MCHLKLHVKSLEIYLDQKKGYKSLRAFCKRIYCLLEYKNHKNHHHFANQGYFLVVYLYYHHLSIHPNIHKYSRLEKAKEEVDELQKVIFGVFGGSDFRDKGIMVILLINTWLQVNRHDRQLGWRRFCLKMGCWAFPVCARVEGEITVLFPIPFVIMNNGQDYGQSFVSHKSRILISLEVQHDNFGLCNYQQLTCSHNLCKHGNDKSSFMTGSDGDCICHKHLNSLYRVSILRAVGGKTLAIVWVIPIVTVAGLPSISYPLLLHEW